MKINISLTEYNNMTPRHIDMLIKCNQEITEEEARIMKQKEQEAQQKTARQQRLANRRR